MPRHKSPLIDAASLLARIGAPGLKLVDASYKMPGVQPTAKQDYLAAHVPGAVFFDIDEIADRSSALPHMVPDEIVFARGAGALGLRPADEIVVCDSGSWMAAPRVWWTLTAFGYENVRVLDGGLAAWVRAGGGLSADVPRPAPCEFGACFDRAALRTRDDILRNIETGREQLVDARSRERFEGAAPEPWPGRRSGRVPGSLNLPYGALIDPSTGTMKTPAILREIFSAAGIDPDRPVVTSCGSGVTAAIINLALARIGVTTSALYDGSWAEWGLPGDLPVATGPASR